MLSGITSKGVSPSNICTDAKICRKCKVGEKQGLCVQDEGLAQEQGAGSLRNAVLGTKWKQHLITLLSRALGALSQGCLLPQQKYLFIVSPSREKRNQTSPLHQQTKPLKASSAVPSCPTCPFEGPPQPLPCLAAARTCPYSELEAHQHCWHGARSPPALLTGSKKPTSTADMGAQTPSGPLLSVRRPPGPCRLAEAAVMFRSPQGFNADKGCSSNKAALLLPISVWKQKLFTCEEHVDSESHHEALWRVRVAYKGRQ